MRQFFATVLLFAATCMGQEFRATISGRVIDAQSSAVPSVKILVVQKGRQAKFEAISDHEGLYSIAFLRPA